jgi:drug/metabolite transporter, DME family
MQHSQVKNSARAGLLMVIFASITWGIGNAVAKSVYDVAQTNPLSVAFLRMALSVPALLLVCWLTLGRRMFALHRRDLPLILIAGALVAFYQASFYASLPRIGVAIATVLALASAPVIVAVLSVFITRERPSRYVVLALGCAMLGTVLIANVSSDAQRPDVLGGGALALLAGALYATNTLVGRKLGSSGRAHPLQTVTFGFAFGALVLFVIGLLSTDLVLVYPIGGWLRLGFLGLVPTALGYALFYTGMRSTSAAAASIATLMEPVTSTLIAVIALREPLSPAALLGMVFLVGAMLVLARDR